MNQHALLPHQLPGSLLLLACWPSSLPFGIPATGTKPAMSCWHNTKKFIRPSKLNTKIYSRVQTCSVLAAAAALLHTLLSSSPAVCATACATGSVCERILTFLAHLLSRMAECKWVARSHYACACCFDESVNLLRLLWLCMCRVEAVACRRAGINADAQTNNTPAEVKSCLCLSRTTHAFAHCCKNT